MIRTTPSNLGNQVFPSPCGEKVGINMIRTTPSNLGNQVFPSPCGEKVGINVLMAWSQ